MFIYRYIQDFLVDVLTIIIQIKSLLFNRLHTFVLLLSHEYCFQLHNFIYLLLCMIKISLLFLGFGLLYVRYLSALIIESVYVNYTGQWHFCFSIYFDKFLDRLFVTSDFGNWQSPLLWVSRLHVISSVWRDPTSDNMVTCGHFSRDLDRNVSNIVSLLFVVIITFHIFLYRLSSLTVNVPGSVEQSTSPKINR